MDDLTWARRTGRAIVRGHLADLVPQEVRDEWENEQDLEDWREESRRRALIKEAQMLLQVVEPRNMIVSLLHE